MLTQVRNEDGIEAAQVFGDHSKATTTLGYAKDNEKLRLKVARKLG